MRLQNYASPLWPDLYRCSIRNGPIDFFDLEVGHGDATGCPVALSMKPADPAISIAKTVNHDVASGRTVMGRGSVDVALLRIRDVQGEMVIAVRFMEIDRVNPFRSPLIAFEFLRADWVAPERHPISL